MRFLILPAIAAALAFTSCQKKVTEAPLTLTTEEDKFSYSLGIDIATNLKAKKLDTFIVNKAFLKGLEDGLDTADNEMIDSQEALRILQDFYRQKEQEARKARLSKFEPNKQAGIKFLEENKQKEGVISTESGLQYKVIRKGWGKKPSATSQVKVHYHGTLIDGTVFDSSIAGKKSKPIVFPLNGVIKGWTEVLQLMRVGAKWEVYIPYNLAYGESGPSPVIKPFSTLVFQIELINIENE